jgi:hypothetical protein
MINKVIDTIKNHKDSFGIVFNTDIFNDSDFKKISENVIKLIFESSINRRERLVLFFYEIEDDFDMRVSTETLDNLVDKLLIITNE